MNTPNVFPTTTAPAPSSVSSPVTVHDDSQTASGLAAPSDWHVIEHRADGLAWERLTGERLTVIEDITRKADGKHWLHVSVAKAKESRMPTYDDLQLVRRLFIGEDRECYLVFPTSERYVNFFHVLHLWCCMDAPEGVLPHFEGYVEGIGLSV